MGTKLVYDQRTPHQKCVMCVYICIYVCLCVFFWSFLTSSKQWGLWESPVLRCRRTGYERAKHTIGILHKDASNGLRPKRPSGSRPHRRAEFNQARPRPWERGKVRLHQVRGSTQKDASINRVRRRKMEDHLRFDTKVFNIDRSRPFYLGIPGDRSWTVDGFVACPWT